MNSHYGWLFEFAHLLGLVPLLWLVVRRERDSRWWWVGAGYGISWVADTLSHWMPHPLIFNAYPLPQVGLILAVLVPNIASRLVVGMTILGCLSIVAFGIPSLWVLHIVAWGGAALVGWWCKERLGVTLVVSFGVGLLAWSFTQWTPGWAAWIAFQSTRLVGTLLLCVAMTAVFPRCGLHIPLSSSSPARSG